MPFMNKRRIVIITILILLVHATPRAQQPDSSLSWYEKNFQQERLYIHFDKSAYFPGDTIWYKVYIMAGFEASAISRNIYTDLADASGNLILHGVAPVVFSSSSGQIAIPSTYKESFVHLHAYTSWMLNFDSAFLFDRNIKIIQPPTPLANSAKSIVHVSLLPEGGNLVQSLLSTVAFKAENQFGQPISITGALRNKSGEVVDSLFTQHDGMGKFFITPDANELYTVEWQDNDGNTGKVPLPPALATGAIFKVSATAGKVSFHVDRTADAPASFKNVHIIGTMQQAEVCRFDIDLQKTTGATEGIPTTQLADGILQLTLFNASWQPVAERVVFVNNNDYSFNAGIKVNRKDLSKRGRNEIEIEVPDTSECNLSISVTDAGLLYDSSYNIISHLLLTSDVRGYINNPAYYFSNSTDSLRNALDLVMLTNGWRHYNWADVMANRPPVIKYPQDTSFITIAGKLTMPRNAPIGSGTTLSLMMRSVNKADSFYSSMLQPVNPNGSFSLSPGIFYDSLDILFKIIGVVKTENRTVINFTGNLLGPQVNFRYLNILPLTLQDSVALLNNLALKARANELAKLLKQTTLKNVTVTAKIKTKLQQIDEDYTSIRFRGGGNTYSVNVIDDPDSKIRPTLASYLVDKIPGLSVVIKSGVDAGTQYMYRRAAIDVYVDETLLDPDAAQTVMIGDVAYIKLFRKGSSAVLDEQPALFIYTRKDGGGGSRLPDVKTVTITGYTPAKEFYSPDYSNTSVMNAGADIRTTLYWQPYLLTNAAMHTLKLVFYNNDISRRLRIVVEGINGEGKLTRVEKVVE